MTILKIQYPNGATRALKANKVANYFTAVEATGRGRRVNVRAAKELIDEFDALCNESEATLVQIDDDAVARIRA